MNLNLPQARTPDILDQVSLQMMRFVFQLWQLTIKGVGVGVENYVVSEDSENVWKTWLRGYFDIRAIVAPLWCSAIRAELNVYISSWNFD